MGLGLSAVKLTLDLWQKGLFKDSNSVIEMGAQELHIKRADLEELLSMVNLSHYKKENFPFLDNYPSSPRCSAQPFYELLGIREYSCVDFGKEHGAIPIDLNYPLEDKSLFNKYDLVTDHGTNEHVFNTSEAFRTMHRLCKPGGILIILQSLYRGNGFYTYDPAFFETMAAANQYKILYSSFTVTLPKLTTHGSAEEYLIPQSQDLLDVISVNSVTGLGICYVMKKQSGDDFRLPTQYFSESLHHYGYQLQYGINPVSREYVAIDNLGCIDKKVLLGEVFRRIKKKIKWGVE